MAEREGGCSCGEVRYRLTAEPMFTHCCHCLNCQRQTGSAFVINLLLEADRVEVTAGEVMASVHYMEAMNSAKKAAARRAFDGSGVPAVRLEDVADGLVEQARAAARQMDADRQMLARQLRVEGRLLRVELAGEEELDDHRYRSIAG